jgi:hypothetical protein
MSAPPSNWQFYITVKQAPAHNADHKEMVSSFPKWEAECADVCNVSQLWYMKC